MLLILSGALPAFARVTVLTVLTVPTWRLENVKFVGVRTATGPELLEPSPVSATVWGVFCALSPIVRVPLRTPEAAGVKIMLNVQLEPGSKLPGQPLACE